MAFLVASKDEQTIWMTCFDAPTRSATSTSKFYGGGNAWQVDCCSCKLFDSFNAKMSSVLMSKISFVIVMAVESQL